MINISNNNIISIYRGDSGSFKIELNLGTEKSPEIYEMQPNDKVYFGVMEPNEPFENGIIRKVYTYNDLNQDKTITIKFVPTDTEYLLCGTYYYSIKLQINRIGGYDVHTIMPKRKFIIEE